jgi:beta-lactamase regulating signal transducer with metallopeptidase domain
MALMAVLPVVTAMMVSVENPDRSESSLTVVSSDPAGTPLPGGSGELPAGSEPSLSPQPALPYDQGLSGAEPPASSVRAAQSQQAASASWSAQLQDAIHPVLPWAILVWLAGVIVMSVWHFGGWVQVRGMRRLDTRPARADVQDTFDRLVDRLGIRRSVRLLESMRVGVPVVIGWLRPLVLLPIGAVTGLTRGQLEAILVHELAHVRRWDCLVQVLQAIMETLLFYHPGVWWVSRRIREESEQCCDDLAVGLCPDRRGYAHALAKVAELGSVGKPAFAVAATGGKLLPRIKRILGAERSGSLSSGRCLSGALALVTIIAIGLAVGVACSSGPESRADGEISIKPRKEFAVLPSKAPYTKATLPDVDRRDVNTILDLHSGAFQKNLMGKGDAASFEKFNKLGKGDLWYDRVLGTIRGASIQKWDGKKATDVKPGDVRFGAGVYPGVVPPARLLVTTFEGKKFDVKLLGTTSDSGLKIEYRPAQAAPAVDDPEKGANDPTPQPSGSRLEFRIVPNGMGSSRLPLIPLFVGRTTQSFAARARKDLSVNGPCKVNYGTGGLKLRWIEMKHKIPRAGLVVPLVAKYKGKDYVLLCDDDPYVMLPAAGGKGQWGLADAFAIKDAQGNPVVMVKFDKNGAKLFEQLTKTNKGNALAVIVDGKVLSSPVIRSTISTHAIITGAFTDQQAGNLPGALLVGMPQSKSPVSELPDLTPMFRSILEDNRGPTGGTILDLDSGKQMFMKNLKTTPAEGISRIDLAWDNDGGGALMRNPRGTTSFLPLPDAQNFDQATGQAARLWESVKKSKLKGMLGSKSRFCAVSTDQGRLAVIEIIKYNPMQVTIKWTLSDVFERGDGQVFFIPRAKFALLPDKAFKASFKTLTLDITSTWAWNRTITIKGDGSYKFDLRQLKKAPGTRGFQLDPNHYIVTYRIAPAHLRQLDKLLAATKWLGGGGKILPHLKDGTKYTMTLLRGGKATTTTCYGQQEQAYTDLIRFLGRINKQEWLLYQMMPNTHYGRNPIAELDSELSGLLNKGKPSNVVPYAPVLDYERLLPKLRSLPAGGQGEKVIAKIKKLTDRDARRKPATQPSASVKRNPTIGIYLVTGRPKDIAFKKTPLAQLTLAGEPLVSQADILTYDWATHTIRLKRQAAADRVLKRKYGEVFVVVVNDRRLYGGSIVSLVSSTTFGVPYIDVSQRQPKCAIRIFPQIGRTIDRRGDKRLKLALQSLNKLSNKVDRSAADDIFGPLKARMTAVRQAVDDGDARKGKAAMAALITEMKRLRLSGSDAKNREEVENRVAMLGPPSDPWNKEDLERARTLLKDLDEVGRLIKKVPASQDPAATDNGKPSGKETTTRPRPLDSVVWDKPRRGWQAGAKLLSTSDKFKVGDSIVVQYLLKNVTKEKRTVVLQQIEGTHPTLGGDNRISTNVTGSSQNRHQHTLGPGAVMEKRQYRIAINTQGMLPGVYTLDSRSPFWEVKKERPNGATGIGRYLPIRFELSDPVRKTPIVYSKPPLARKAAEKIHWGKRVGGLIVGMRLPKGRTRWTNESQIEAELFIRNVNRQSISLTYQVPPTDEWNMQVQTKDGKGVQLGRVWNTGFRRAVTRSLTIKPGQQVSLIDKRQARGPTIQVAKAAKPMKHGEPARLTTKQGSYIWNAYITVTQKTTPDLTMVIGSGPVPFEIGPATQPADKGADKAVEAEKVKLLRTSILAEAKTDWSTPQEGVAIRLTSPRKTWRANEIPTLRWHVRNKGPRKFLSVGTGQRLAQLEVDGVWRRWPIHMRGGAMADMGAGKLLENQLVTVSPIWSQAKQRDLEWSMGGYVTESMAPTPSLQLSPGKHTLRVAVLLNPSRVNTGKGFRVVSQPLEFTVTAVPNGEKPAWPPGEKTSRAVKDVLLATLTPLQESGRPQQPKMKEWIDQALAQSRTAAALARKTPLHASTKRLTDALDALQNALARDDRAGTRKGLDEMIKAYIHLVGVFSGEVRPVAARLPATRPAA